MLQVVHKHGNFYKYENKKTDMFLLLLKSIISQKFNIEDANEKQQKQ